MLRKAYVPGAAALLAALLAGCTGGSQGDGRTDDANPQGDGTTTAAAQPGKYRTLPEPCGAIGHGTLDSLLPGIRQIRDADQRDTAYQGEAALTYDTERKVGCRWKVDSAEATDRLHIDFERVVSYDDSVSDDSQAQTVFASRQAAADLPARAAAPAPGGPGSAAPSAPASLSSAAPSSPAAPPTGAPSSSADGGAGSPSSSPADLQPRTLDGLGDEAFLDDRLAGSGSSAKQRTVTVAFRTSNVIVTVEYEEQPAALGVVPDSAQMQDKAGKLAARLADALSG
ncbi:DUF3558 domain-containing protein [Streptomyces sp. NPDC046985]|uniref:DUF3558 domain-containing protein n=1 Tax=Streptomyces sp. NPDC046985 TaxID=3155377 RepID=UPI0033D489FB